MIWHRCFYYTVRGLLSFIFLVVFHQRLPGSEEISDVGTPQLLMGARDSFFIWFDGDQVAGESDLVAVRATRL
jgi:hypothetical protein